MKLHPVGGVSIFYMAGPQGYKAVNQPLSWYVNITGCSVCLLRFPLRTLWRYVKLSANQQMGGLVSRYNLYIVETSAQNVLVWFLVLKIWLQKEVMR